MFLFVCGVVAHAQLITHDFTFVEGGTVGNSKKAKRIKESGSTSVRYVFDNDRKKVSLSYKNKEVEEFDIIAYMGEEEGMSVYMLKDKEGKKVELKYYGLGKSVLLLYKKEYIFFY